MNLFSLFQSAFPADRDKPAFILPDGKEVSYHRLEHGAGHVASALAAAGVRPGDRVAVMAEKTVATVQVYLGVLQLGAVFLPLNPTYGWKDIKFFCEDAQAAMVIEDAVAFVKEARALPPAKETVPARPTDLAAILYTSGTTGRSKGVCITHGALAANAKALHAAWGFTPDDVLLHALPIFHVHGLFIAMHCAFLSGAPMVWLSKFSEEEVMANLPRATVMMGVPTFYTRLLANPDFTAEAARNIRVFISGSAPLLPTTFEAFEVRTGQRILERYGMTEAVIITTNPLEGDRLPGSVGYPLPGVDLRLSDAGVIEIKGPSVFTDYWRMPEKTAEDFTADGYFITGDVGRLDPDGRLWISGRAKDLIITGGMNVYPKEIELILDQLPGVEESVVIGLPHGDFGEGVVAVVLGRGDEAELIAKCRADLAPYKVPKRVLFVSDLPRNAMGKVQKNKLREEHAALFD